MANEDLEKLKAEIEAKAKGQSLDQVRAGLQPTNTQAPQTVIFTPKIPETHEDPALTESRKGSSAAGEMVTEIFKQGVVHTVANDQEVQKKILDTAKGVVGDKVDALKQQSLKEVQASTFDANRDACENYGIERDVPIWKINMMKVGSAFWFIIYFIFATLTVAPITIFLKGLSGAIKKVWLAAVVAVLFYLLLAVGVPLLVHYVPIWISGK